MAISGLPSQCARWRGPCRQDHQRDDEGEGERDQRDGGEPLAQKCSVPSLAEPRPRTRASGVRMELLEFAIGIPTAGVGRDPDRDRQGDGEAERGQGEQLALDRSEAAPGVPDEMADAAQHVVEQRPGVAEQHELADPGAVGPADQVERLRRDVAATSQTASSSVPK